MKIFKKLVLVLVVAIIISGIAYFYAQNSTSSLAQKLTPYTDTLTPVVEAITPYTKSVHIPDTEIPEVATLAEKGKELTEHVGVVLGDSVSEADPEKQPLHERAVEYGQYIYCKGIVEEYENNHDTTSPSE